MQTQNHTLEEEALRPVDAEVVKLLLDNQKKFLGFLKKRTGSSEIAEEILQDAYVKTFEKGSDLKVDEGAVAWFYRLLRNALIDHYRRLGTKDKVLGKKTEEDELLRDERDPEIENAICECMKTLLPTLKDEYADVLNRVDLKEQSISEVASEAGISVNNVNVRLHRARLSLKKQLEKSCGACATHGCLDCSCKAHRVQKENA